MACSERLSIVSAARSLTACVSPAVALSMVANMRPMVCEQPFGFKCCHAANPCCYMRIVRVLSA